METPFNSTANIGGGNNSGRLQENYGGTSSSIASSNSNNESKINKLTPQQQRLQQMITMQRAQQNQLQLQMQMSSMSRNPATGVTAPRRYSSIDEDHHQKIKYPNYIPDLKSHGDVRVEESVLLEKEISGNSEEEEVSGVTANSLEDDDFTNNISNSKNYNETILQQDHSNQNNNNPMHTMDFSSGPGKNNDYSMIQRNFIQNNHAYPGPSTMMMNNPSDNLTTTGLSTNTENPTILNNDSYMAKNTIDNTNNNQNNSSGNNNSNSNVGSNLSSNPYMMMMSVEEQKSGFSNENIRMKNNSPISQGSNPQHLPQQQQQQQLQQLQQQSQKQTYHAPKILHHQDKCHYNTYAQSQYHYNDANNYHNKSSVHDPYADFEAEYGYDCNGCAGSFTCCDDDMDDFGRHQQQQSNSLCFWCDCFSHIATAENLHRSICFGAIDGMLTGSGIVAACFGLGWFTYSSTATIAMAAFSLSACTSDGICMAIGHVWSNYVLTKSSIKERTEQRSNFDIHRSEAKGKLVDMLLMRGMLKIDATSIADILEGYPEIFVSAISGDGVTNGMLPQYSDHSIDIGGSLRFAKNYPSYGSHGSGNAGTGSYGYSNPEEGYYGHGHYLQHGGIRRRPSYSNSQRSFTNINNQNGGFSSSAAANHHFWSNAECEDDPDDIELNTALTEGFYEGIFMMIAFCIFSMLPSLIFIYIPPLVNSQHSQYPRQSYNNYHNHHSSYNNKYYNHTTSSDYGTVVSIFVLSVIMIVLGIWKSRFFQSNFVVFGIETVLVLYLSLASAYGIGYALSPYVK